MSFKKRFSIEYYRQALNAWKVCVSEVTDTSSANTSGYSSGQSMDSTSIARELTEMDMNSSVCSLTDKTLELNDSIQSIPETPEVVTKRKRNSDKCYKKQKKRLVSKFINFESEVALDSMDSLSDDIECTQTEMESLSQSYINDNTLIDSQPVGQLIGDIDSRASDDMHSVYLRSIVDRKTENGGHFRLQFNYDPNIEVYSQEPNESELEDYQMDDFCVPNDCVIFDDSTQLATNTITGTSESPEPQMISRKRKKFKRIVVFSP